MNQVQAYGGKRSDSSNTAIYPVSTLYEARPERRSFTVQKSFHRVLLLYDFICFYMMLILNVPFRFR